jgi:hypothetical protein
MMDVFSLCRGVLHTIGIRISDQNGISEEIMRHGECLKRRLDSRILTPAPSGHPLSTRSL